MADNDDQDGAVGAERAFEGLRAEVQVMRRAVEAMPLEWEDKRPPDYTPNFARIEKAISVFERRLAAVEGQPALQRTPEQYAGAIQRAGEGATASAVRHFDQATRETQTTGRMLAEMIGQMRGQEKQQAMLLWTGLIAAVIALAIGWIGGPYFDGTLLPQGWEEDVAAIAMNTTRWKAGTALVEASDPKAWARLVADWTLISDNKSNNAAVAACRATVMKTKKAQECRIIVPVPK